MNKTLKNQNFLSFFAGVIIIFYLSLGFVPNLSAVDKIAPQWLLMSIINGLGFIFLVLNQKHYSNSISSTLSSTLSVTYIGFIIWASLSYFYAINPTEVIVNITRQVNVLLMYLLIGIFLFSFNQKIQFICWIIVTVLGIEVYSVINEAQTMISTNGIISSGDLKGVTANRNITNGILIAKENAVIFLLAVTPFKSPDEIIPLVLIMVWASLITE